ncbi:TPA: DUF551 domain-containing protein [Escherichia coli]|nr:DUF551 domain-containing protein [Escherichia coli]HBA3683127.1 DUF551 domain-containing protein [Escherichia coli]HBH7951071.1 DUF551 domain-containing protein [Escherichia coli]
MTTITKERLLTIKQWRETYGPGSNVVLPAEEAEELARIALASLAAESVSVNDDMAYAFHHALSDSSLGADEVEEIKTGLRAAFANVTIQPEPVVPDEIALAIENLKQKLVECNRYNYCADAVKGVEDACRAVSYSQADNQPASGNQAAESNRGNEWTGNPDIDNAIIMLDRIDTLENCDDDRIEAVKAVLRRLAGNHPDFPDSSQQSPKKSVKTTLERGYLEAALKIKPGHTLGVIDAMLVHEMAKALLPLVADKIPNKADI